MNLIGGSDLVELSTEDVSVFSVAEIISAIQKLSKYDLVQISKGQISVIRSSTPRGPLRTVDYGEVDRLLNEGKTVKEIADKFLVSMHAIWKIKRVVNREREHRLECRRREKKKISEIHGVFVPSKT